MRRRFLILALALIALPGCSMLKGALKSLSITPDLRGVVVGELVRAGESILVQVAQLWSGDRSRAEVRTMRITDPELQAWALGNLAPGVPIQARGGGTGSDFVPVEMWETKSQDGAAVVLAYLQGRLNDAPQGTQQVTADGYVAQTTVPRLSDTRRVEIVDPAPIVEASKPLSWADCEQAHELLDLLAVDSPKEAEKLRKILPECE
jgi:hypothetical protein